MDFSNTFDSISHNYMLDLLELLHFSSNFICTIQNLTYQTSTHILFNKSVSNINIPIQRGSALTRALNIIDTFSEVSELFINKKKSAVIYSPPPPHLSVSLVFSVSYLGFKFDSHGLVN
eukprot:TRINITY_DN1215_c1_g1_i4.p1 TRINITY_DN1215_c1_g1~~TRINITY_DN1215_c1_g1_i4.p1  ORF type:complete len:119 (+),score=5.03 TRINITY_DN1215_c1_g1_i4:1118-1474(+)